MSHVVWWLRGDEEVMERIIYSHVFQELGLCVKEFGFICKYKGSLEQESAMIGLVLQNKALHWHETYFVRKMENSYPSEKDNALVKENV